MVLAGGVTTPLSFSAISGMDNAVSGSAGYLNNAASGSLSTANQDASNYTPPASYLWILAIFFLLLVVIKYLTEHEKSGMDVHFVGIGLYNLMAITLMAGLGITTVKIVANKYQVIPALTDIINTW